MQIHGRQQKFLYELVALTYVVVCVDCSKLRDQRLNRGIDIPEWRKRAAPHLRIPHQAFQTWLGEDPKKPKLMSHINRFRAKICYDMHDAHGEKFDSFEACKEFMEHACRPGGDLMMDGDKNEHSSGHGYCNAYFPKDEKEAEEILEEMERQEDEEKQEEAEEKHDAEALEGKEASENIVQEEAKKTDVRENDAAADAGAAPAAAAPATADEAGKAKDAKEGDQAAAAAAGSAPAAAGSAPAASPSGAPSPAGQYPEDEAWYYKNGGTDPIRYHMNEAYKLPTHGYHGELVEHDDMKTVAADWHAEFGDSHDIAGVCKEHPDNPWCHKKGFGGSGANKHDHSGAPMQMKLTVLALPLLTATAFLF
jgi:hypothetical protein